MTISEDIRAGGVETADPRTAALQSLRRKRDFRAHLTAYVAVNACLLCIWAIVGTVSGAWFPWPLFPIVGWGVGLFFHGWATYGLPSRPITEAQIEAELRRRNRDQ